MASYVEEVGRLRATPLDQLCGLDRRLKLLVEHPQTSPDIREALPYLIHPPSSMARTSSHERFRRMLLDLIAHRPDDRRYPRFLACTEAVLIWRATIRPEDRFWSREPDESRHSYETN